MPDKIELKTVMAELDEVNARILATVQEIGTYADEGDESLYPLTKIAEELCDDLQELILKLAAVQK